MLHNNAQSRLITLFAIRRKREAILKPLLSLFMFYVIGHVVEALLVEKQQHISQLNKILFTVFIPGPFIAATFLVVNHLDRLQRQLAHLAMTDVLTGLPNRRAFLDDSSTPVEGFLVILDADHFKRINDTYGHAVGDACLKAVADHIKQNTRKNDMVARIGGEEFAAFMPSIDLVEVEGIGERLAGPITIVIEDGQRSLQLTLSLGAAHRQNTETIEDAFQRADIALYVAKATGRARLVIWNKEIPPHAA